MPQLLVRNIPQVLVRKLKRRAVDHGVSTEEEHRRILRDALTAKTKKERTLMDFLLDCDEVSGGELPLERSKDRTFRDVEF